MSRRRATSLLAAGLAAGALAVVALAGPAGADPGQEAPSGTGVATAAATPSLTIAGQDLEVAPDGDFRVFVDVDGAPAGGGLSVDLYPRIDSIEDLAASTTTSPGSSLATFATIPLASKATAATQTAPFTLYLYGAGDPRPTDVPRAWTWKLEEPGVYPVRIRLLDEDENALTTVVTYLVRRPDAGQSVEPTDVALLTSVHQPPGTKPGEADPAPVDPTYRRRLDTVLAAFADQPDLAASFVVTPQTAVRLRSDPDAADTLADLKREVGRSSRALLGAPFVDVDPASLVTADLGDELARQADLGTDELSLTVGTPTADTWALDRPVDSGALGALRTLGVTRVVVPSTSLSANPVPGPVRLPAASGTVTAITTGFFDLTGARPADPVLAANQLLARLIATGQLDEGPTGLAVRIDPAKVDPTELATVLSALASPDTPLRATTLDRLFREVPVAAGTAALAPVSPTDLGSYPELARRTRHLLASYQSMVPDQTALAQALQQPLAISASADLSLADRRRDLEAIEEQVQSRFAGISTPTEDRVTLGARDARFPLPITSKLGEPVKVVISLEASDRLSFPDATIETTLTNERTLVQIPVRTRATGDTPLRITVRTPDGNVILAESRYRVRSTAVSGVGVLLTIGAGGFLALWWGRHWLRSRRRPGRHAAAT